MFSPPLKKSIVFLKYALKMDLVKGAWFDLYVNDMSYLENFRLAVKDVNSAEKNIIGSVGSTVAVTAIAAYLTGGIGAGSAAAGGSAAIVAAFTDLDNACDNADYYFGRVEFAPY